MFNGLKYIIFAKSCRAGNWKSVNKLSVRIPCLISESFFLNDPELQNEVPLSYLSHKELYEASIRKTTIISKKIRQLQQQQGQDGVKNDL